MSVYMCVMCTTTTQMHPLNIPPPALNRNPPLNKHQNTGAVSVSHLDVAPNHAGVVFAAGNTAATLAGLIGVPLTGFILNATNSWLLVFSVTAAHYVVGAVVWWWWVGDKQLPEDQPQ